LSDIVDPATRSRMMSRIRGKDTSPEKIVRSGLHGLGYRFRLHDPKLPGRPDLVFRSRRAVIEIRGCFWHGHDCGLFRWPSTRSDFWRQKIVSNIDRDERNRFALLEAGWRLAVVWECQIKGGKSTPGGAVLQELCRFLDGSDRYVAVGNSNTVIAPGLA
jgi:DNA mismatch endonuclease, patch repair protein